MDSFDAHVVIHFFLHECGLSLVFALFRDNLTVEFFQVSQIVHNKRGLVVKRANGVVTIHGVIEAQSFEVGQFVHGQDFLKMADVIAS